MLWSIFRSNRLFQRIYPQFAELSQPRPRCMFSTSCARSAGKKKLRPSSKNPSVTSKPVPTLPQVTVKVPSYRPFAETLALRQSPTLLFQASSHLSYTIGYYGLGVFCFAWAGINFYTQYLYPPEGIGATIPVVIGGVCIFMVFVGVYFIRRVSRCPNRLSKVEC